jgi:hypothetical protein
MAGADTRTVAQLLEHRTIKVTVRYAHLASEHNEEAVEKLVSPSEKVVFKSVTTTLIIETRNEKKSSKLN